MRYADILMINPWYLHDNPWCFFDTKNIGFISFVIHEYRRKLKNLLEKININLGRFDSYKANKQEKSGSCLPSKQLR